MPETIENINLIEAFRRAAVGTNIPLRYLYWVSMTMIGAVMQRQVWVVQNAWDRIYPNLYTFCVGGSGSGKGQALNIANYMINGMNTYCDTEVYVYRGKLTFAALYDFIHAGNDKPSRPVLLFAPELANSLGDPRMGKQFLATMTDLYESHSGTPYTEGTRGKGFSILQEPCVSWIAATNHEDIREIISEKEIRNGLLARVCAIIERRDAVGRMALQEHNQERFLAYYTYIINKMSMVAKEYTGEMYLSPDATLYWRNWHMKRSEPAAEVMRSTWNRLPMMALKLSMVHHLAARPDGEHPEGGGWRYISEQAMVRACRDTGYLLASAESFVEGTLDDQYNPKLYKIAAYLYDVRECLESKVARRFDQKDLKWVLAELARMGLIEREEINDPESRLCGKIMVRWIGPWQKRLTWDAAVRIHEGQQAAYKRIVREPLV